MPKKRANGEGTLYKRKDGTWTAQASAGRDPKTGKPKRLTFYGRTKNEARVRLHQALQKLDAGLDTTPTRMTFGDWIDHWYSHYLRPRARPTTADSYEMLIRVHLKPSLGHIPLRSLRTSDLQQVLNAKFDHGRVDGHGGLSVKSVRYLRTIAYGALKQAVAEGLLSRNPAEAVRLPKRVPEPVRPLTRAEVESFLNQVANHRLRAAFLLALGSGLRRGEVMALHWADVNLDRGHIRVTRSLVRVRDHEAGVTKLVFQPPKTDASMRTVPVPGVVVRELQAHRRRQLAEKMAAGPAYHDLDLVFAAEDGQAMDPSGLGRLFRKTADAVGLVGASLHSTRHTYATRLLELGEHPKVVQELLGHGSIEVTLDTYSHVSLGLKEKAAKRLEDILPARDAGASLQ